MVSLREIYNSLQKSDNTVDIVTVNPISYIKLLKEFKENEKIIFVCKIIKNNHVEKNSKEIQILQCNETTKDLDLTGSPLKDEFEIDSLIDNSINKQIIGTNSWNIEDEQYTPISGNTARQLITTANRNNFDNGCIWILCDGLDEDYVLLEREFNASWNYRGIVNIMNNIPFHDININNLVAKHFSYIQQCNKIDTNIDIYFKIELNSTLKFSWNTSSLKPSLNSYNKADITLFQTIKICNQDSITWDYWIQLNLLNKIRDNILKFKDSEDESQLIFNCASPMEMQLIKDQIKKILCEVSSYPLNSEKANINNEIENIVLDAKEREYSDITDSLWRLLINCGSYNNLKLAFNLIFQYAAKSNIINIPTNNNRLANLIREITQGRLAIPCLIGCEPLELLLEIGMEKLSNDYDYIFTESHICTLNDLKQLNKNVSTETGKQVRKTLFNKNVQNKTNVNNETTDSPTLNVIGFQNSQFDVVESEKNLIKLIRIHIILEHLLLIQINLNLNNMFVPVANHITNSSITLDIFTSNSKLNDECQIQILNDSILLKIEDKQPYAQRIVMHSENNLKKISNTFYYSLAPIFPTNLFKFMKKNDDYETNKNNVYYSYHYMKIGTKCC